MQARCAWSPRRGNDEERETYGDTFTDVHRPIASAATRAFNIKPAIGRGWGRGGGVKKRKEKGTDARRYFASSVSLFVPSGGGGCLRMREFFFFFFLFNAIISPFPSNYARAWRLSGSSRNYFPD